MDSIPARRLLEKRIAILEEELREVEKEHQHYSKHRIVLMRDTSKFLKAIETDKEDREHEIRSLLKVLEGLDD